MFSWWNLFENGGFSKTWWKPGDFFKIHQVFTRFWKITKLKQIVENVVIFQNLVKTWWILKKSPGFHQVFENRDFEKPGVFFPKITRFSPGFWISPSVLKLWWKLGVFLNPPLVCVNFICRKFWKKRFWQLDIFAKRLLGSGTKTASWKRFFGSEPNT